MTIPPPDDAPPSDAVDPAPPPRPRSPALLVATGAVVALVVAAVVAVAFGGGGDGGDDAGSAAGDAISGAASTTVPSNVGTVTATTADPSTAAGSADGGDGGTSVGAGLPPVTIPAEASPPTTIPGSEPSSIPVDIMTGEEAPQWGTIVVDLDEGGYQDHAVRLRQDQELSLLSLADDGVQTEIEVFAPDGSSEGSWQGGEPGVVNGLEWYHPDEPLPATGTYVIRVVHTGGSHEPFALGFFGNA